MTLNKLINKAKWCMMKETTLLISNYTKTLFMYVTFSLHVLIPHTQLTNVLYSELSPNTVFLTHVQGSYVFCYKQ